MKLDVAFQSDQHFNVKFEETEQYFAATFETEQSFDVVMAETEESFDVTFQTEEKVLDVTFGENTVVEHIEGTAFDGPYEVTPLVDAQTLPTKYKLMVKDLTVLSVPYFEADNDNGTTIFIASEV